MSKHGRGDEDDEFGNKRPSLTCHESTSVDQFFKQINLPSFKQIDLPSLANYQFSQRDYTDYTDYIICFEPLQSSLNIIKEHDKERQKLGIEKLISKSEKKMKHCDDLHKQTLIRNIIKQANQQLLEL